MKNKIFFLSFIGCYLIFSCSKVDKLSKVEQVFSNYDLCNKGELNKCLEVVSSDQHATTAYKKACDGSLLYGCVLLGDVLRSSNKLEDAKILYDRACKGGNKYGCDALFYVNEQKCKQGDKQSCLIIAPIIERRNKEVKCINKDGTNDESIKPLRVLLINKDISLLLCVYDPVGAEFYSEFVIVERGKTIPKIILEVLDAANGIYKVDVDKEKKEMIINRYLSVFGSEKVPFLRYFVRCSKEKDCYITEPECILKLVRQPESSIANKSDDYWNVFNLALFGDKKAIDFINNATFDGHLGEEFAYAKSILKLAKEACGKFQTIQNRNF